MAENRTANRIVWFGMKIQNIITLESFVLHFILRNVAKKREQGVNRWCVIASCVCDTAKHFHNNKA